MPRHWRSSLWRGRMLPSSAPAFARLTLRSGRGCHCWCTRTRSEVSHRAPNGNQDRPHEDGRKPPVLFGFPQVAVRSESRGPKVRVGSVPSSGTSLRSATPSFGLVNQRVSVTRRLRAVAARGTMHAGPPRWPAAPGEPRSNDRQIRAEKIHSAAPAILEGE